MRRTSLAAQLILLALLASGLMAPVIRASQPQIQAAPLFSPAMSTAELRERISALVPAAADTSLSDEIRVTALRSWLNGFLLLADNYTSSEIDHNQATLAELLASTEKRQAGYLCGAVSVIAQRTYELFGFEAITLNFGFPSTGATHITTLVRLRTLDGPIWSMQGAYFNHTISHHDGRLMDFRDFVRLLAEDRSQEIFIKHDSASRSLMAYGHQQSVAELDAKLSLSAELVSRHAPFDIYRVRWEMARVLAGIPSYRESLHCEAGTDNLLYLFLFPISHSGHESAIMMAKAAADARIAYERRLPTLSEPKRSCRKCRGK